jgi:hypothetical protein
MACRKCENYLLCCVCRLKINVALDNASAVYLICSDADCLVSKLERYSRFHGSSPFIDVC